MRGKATALAAYLDIEQGEKMLVGNVDAQAHAELVTTLFDRGERTWLAHALRGVAHKVAEAVA